MKAICSLLAVLCSICLIYCSKKGTPPAAQPGPGVPNDPHGTSTCHTQLSDAEQVMLFPADNPWNKDISASAVDSASGQILAAYAHTGVFADFGSGLWQGAPIGIPFVVVCASQPKIPVVYRSNAYDGNYGDESDPGPYPIPLDAPIEGNGQGDSHVIAIDKDSGVLYELYNASVNGGHWEASSGAIFHLHSDALRPDGWTSADAAGLPIFPGLVRYEEIVKGEIPHPIRFTLTKSHIRPGHISPARHDVNSSGGTYSLRFGARIRLKAGFDLSGFSASNQVILKAMKKYGLILADVGSDMYITGAPDSRWNNDDLKKLGQVTAADFEVIR